MHWQPTASLEAWRQRADLHAAIRAFFKVRDVLAVETPLLYPHGVTDPAIQSFAVPFGDDTWHLQTSPEFAMKRLLADAPVAMYQLCKAFRREEVGRQHQVEFTMLEWYRPHWAMMQLIAEVGELLQTVLACDAIETLTYQALFEQHCALNPHTTSIAQLQAAMRDAGIVFEGAYPDTHDDCLHVLMAQVIEPSLPQDHPVAVVGYPASQAALAELDPGPPSVAMRFEVYMGGLELANGYQELCDPKVQRERMVADNVKRSELGLPAMLIDESLLAALDHGLPPCAGVALGVDRLMMLKHGYDRIDQTLCFGLV